MVCIVFNYGQTDTSQAASNLRNTQGTYNTSGISKLIEDNSQPMDKNQNENHIYETIFMKKHKVELISQTPKIAKER